MDKVFRPLGGDTFFSRGDFSWGGWWYPPPKNSCKHSQDLRSYPVKETISSVQRLARSFNTDIQTKILLLYYKDCLLVIRNGKYVARRSTRGREVRARKRTKGRTPTVPTRLVLVCSEATL